MKKHIYSEDHKRIASRLKKARSDSGLSQAEAAKSIGISQSYLSKLESGQVKIDIVSLKEFAKLYRKNLTVFTS